MSRKDTLRALLTAREQRLPVGNSEGAPGMPVESALSGAVSASSGSPPSAAPKPLVRSGAVGAMGRSLGKLAHAAEEARALMGAGTAVVEIDPALIESSFVADRFDGSAEDHAALVESIREHGQQVPILVRPHPTRPSHFQIAYGHRRWRALMALGRPVRAVVRSLSDAELVVAQGQENSARLDLSYIERAHFAVAIEDRGFDRAVLMAALGIEKTQLSRLISIGRAIPRDVIQAIGPAPKAGRPRWAALAEIVPHRDWRAVLARLEADPSFRIAESDRRLALFEAALSAKPVHKEAETFASPTGVPTAAIRRTGHKISLVIDQKVAPDFGEFVVRALPDLYRRYAAERGGGEGAQ